MYIVRRAAQVAGIEGLDWATRITKVVQDAGVPASLWLGGLGTVPGSVAWSAPVASVAEWAELTAGLLDDPAYRQASADGRDVIIGFEPDRLMRIVHGRVDGPAEIGAYLGAIEAVVHPERSLEAATFAVEIADAWTAVTGAAALVTDVVAGEQGTITWYARYDDATVIDAADAEVAASPEYAEVLAKGSGLFTSAARMYGRRVA